MKLDFFVWALFSITIFFAFIVSFLTIRDSMSLLNNFKHTKKMKYHKESTKQKEEAEE
jgi:hypothetical protein